MAVKDSREVLIEASPAEIFAVIADVDSAPSWSSQYQSAEVLETFPDGRPKLVKMKVKAAGITDEQTVEYHWGEDTAGWTLIKAGQMRSQEATYTLTPQGDKTKVRFDLVLDPSIPLPGFIVKQVIRGAMDTATNGLRKQVLKIKKSG
ncbi:MAG: SRPBCC family protein [Mycobacterium sp.]